MRERRNRKGMNTAKVAGWKKAVVLMLALIMCISSIVVPQPEEVSAKAANRIDFKINGKTGSKVTLYAGEYVKFTIVVFFFSSVIFAFCFFLLTVTLIVPFTLEL